MKFPHFDQSRTALLIVSIGAFLIPFMGSSLSIALPLIGQDLTGNLILLGWLPTVFVLANAAFLLPFGKLADIYGRKKIFTYGVIIYTAASLMAALSPTVTFLIFGSFLQGLGCSLIFATGVALLSSVFPKDHRGGALGLFITSVYIGLFLGPLLGGLLVGILGWRSIFLFNVPLGLFLLILIHFKLKSEWKGKSGEIFDLTGTIIYIPSLVALLYGFTALDNYRGIIIFLAGLAGFIFFFYRESRILHPIFRVSEFKNRVTAFSAAGLLLVNISTTALWTLLSLYFQYVLALTPQLTALILASQPLMVVVISPMVGRFSDRADSRIFTLTGTFIITGGLLILSGISWDTSIWFIVPGLVLIGMGIAFFSPPATNIFMGSIRKEDYGMASATLSTMVYAGQTISLAILLIIFASFLGNAPLTPSNYGTFLESLKTAFFIFAGFSGLGVVISLLIGSRVCPVINKNN